MRTSDIPMNLLQIEPAVRQNDCLKNTVKQERIELHGYIKMVTKDSSIYQLFIWMDFQNSGYFIRTI